MENFYLKITLIKFGSCIVLFAPFVWYCIFPDTNTRRSVTGLFLSVMIFMLVLATSVVDLVCYLDITEVLQCCNWSYTEIGKRSTSNIRKFLQEFEFKQGLLTLAFVFGFTTFAIVASIGLVYSEMDPLFAILNIGLNVFRICLPNTVSNVFKIFRYVAVSYVSLLIVASFRTLAICGIVGGFYRGKLLLWMSCQTINLPIINLYRQALLAQKVMNSFDYKASAATFGCAFGVIIFGVYVCILGQIRESAMLICVGAIGIFGGCVLLQCFFLVGCAYYKNSVKALAKWRIDLGKSGPSRFFRRVVKSLKPVAMPAGEVGIIDQDIKINYSDKLLEYVVDVVISTNEIM